MSRAIGGRSGDPGADSDRGEFADHFSEHGFFAAEEMGDAGDVQHQPVGVRCDDGRKMPLHPDGEFFKRDAVGVGIGVHDDKVGDEGLRFAGGYAGSETFAPRRLVGGQHHAPPSLMADKDERRIKRRRVRGHRPPQPVGGPARQE